LRAAALTPSPAAPSPAAPLAAHAEQLATAREGDAPPDAHAHAAETFAENGGAHAAGEQFPDRIEIKEDDNVRG
jgi:hypothetical protein